MVQLARIEQAASAWRDAAPQELPPTGAAVYIIESFLGTHELPFADQVYCMLKRTHHFSDACKVIISACWAVP